MGAGLGCTHNGERIHYVEFKRFKMLRLADRGKFQAACGIAALCGPGRRSDLPGRLARCMPRHVPGNGAVRVY
jgi:hypothetical protein